MELGYVFAVVTVLVVGGFIVYRVRKSKDSETGTGGGSGGGGSTPPKNRN